MIKHAAWPTKAPPVYPGAWDQKDWDRFAKGFRPEGYTGNVHDMKAYSEYRYQQQLSEHAAFYEQYSRHNGDYMLQWRLWLDDDCNNYEARERWIPGDSSWIGAETSEEAIELVQKYGFDSLALMDLDHDLGLYPDGSERTAKTFLKWLTETYPDGRSVDVCKKFDIPRIPEFKVHSRNVDGAPWILSYLDSWKRSLEM